MSDSQSDQDRTVQLLATLRDGAPVLEPAESRAQREGRRVEKLERLIVTLPQSTDRWSLRNRALAGASFGLAAAAGVALWLNLPVAPTDTPAAASPLFAKTMATATSEPPPPKASQFERATKAGSRLTLPDGAVAELLKASDLRLEAQSVKLAEGTVRFRVPPQAPGQRFTVATPNANVAVIGTVFTVTVQRTKNVVRSCVSVEEGRVRVSSAAEGREIGVGERWSSDGQPCTGSLVAAPSSSHARRPAAPTAGATPKVPESKDPKVNRLAEQNRLFAAAVRARRAGKYGQARRQLDELLRRHPETPLRPLVARERERIQRQQP